MQTGTKSLVKVGDVITIENSSFVVADTYGNIYGISRDVLGKNCRIQINDAVKVIGKLPEDILPVVRISPGYNLAAQVKKVGYPALRGCMEKPQGFYYGYAKNRYILSGFAFEEVFEFIEAWNKKFSSMQYLLHRSEGLTVAKVSTWYNVLYGVTTENPMIYYISVQLKNKWSNRFIAKLMAVFLRTFFLGEAAQKNNRSQEESIMDYFIRLVNGMCLTSHYFSGVLSLAQIEAINALELIPEMGRENVRSQTLILNKCLAGR
jgi:hypothetical protein